LRSIGLSAAVAAALFVLLAFPSQLFNSTLQENYEEVPGWFHLRRPMAEVVQRFDQRLVLPLFLVAGGVLYAVLAPGFGFNRSTAALALGLAVARSRSCPARSSSARPSAPSHASCTSNPVTSTD
jgi:hypothetical protein